MTLQQSVPNVNLDTLREEVSKEYAVVATQPQKGFHFHTGRPLAEKLGYPAEQIDGVPAGALESFAGTGNPFSVGALQPGERVVDLGSGAGFDSLIAAAMVGASGRVVGVDMTPEMLAKATDAAAAAGLTHAEFVRGHLESLRVEDEWADVVISNGVVNLCPDKLGVFKEMNRVLKPGGRLQIGDILVQIAVPEEAKENIDL